MRFNDESFSPLASAQAGQVLRERAMICREYPRGREEVVLTTILSLHPAEYMHDIIAPIYLLAHAVKLCTIAIYLLISCRM